MAATDVITSGAPLTVQITTGNPNTVNDAYDTTKPNNGAKNPLGSAVYIRDSSGRLKKLRYVRHNPTAAVTEIVGPVYWKDNLRTVVTPTRSESIMGDTINAGAGFLLNTSVTDGNYVFIQVNGYLASAAVPASTAPSDALVSATGLQAMARVAAGTAPTGIPLAIAITAVSGGLSDIFVCCESL